MVELIRRPCPLCAGAEARPHRAVRDVNERTCDARFTLERCLACGFVFLNPAPAPETLGAYYPAHYRAHADGGAATLLRRSRRRERRLGTLLQAPRGRLLDVGCGSGGDLVQMREAGWEGVGLELDPGAAAAARGRGFQVVEGQAEQLPESLGRFDAITLFHTLEHFWDPLAVLRAVRERLAAGGVALVRVPNFGCLEARWFGPDWFPLEVPRHLNFFVPRTLAALLYRAGLRVRAVATHYMIGAFRYSWRNRRRLAEPPDFKRHRLAREGVRLLSRVALAFRSGNELEAVASR
jgi:SAM-dependent methyltransferase